MTRRLGYVLLVAGAFVAGIATGCWADDWFDIDTCLDRGGAWNYDRDTCEHA